MVRTPATSTAFSRRVVAAVERLRDQRRMSNTELIREADLSANYFYVRLRGESPFNTNDIEKLARALDVEPYEVLQLAESAELGVDEDAERLERVEGPELARRLVFLTAGPTGPDGRSFSVPDLVAFAAERSLPVTGEDWNGLLAHAGPVRVPVRVLELLSAYFAVDGRYLRSTRDSELAQLVEAEIGLQRALADTGATAVSARALGGMSAVQLEAITRAIRSIDTNPNKNDSPS